MAKDVITLRILRGGFIRDFLGVLCMGRFRVRTPREGDARKEQREGRAQSKEADGKPEESRNGCFSKAPRKSAAHFHLDFELLAPRT